MYLNNFSDFQNKINRTINEALIVKEEKKEKSMGESVDIEKEVTRAMVANDEYFRSLRDYEQRERDMRREEIEKQKKAKEEKKEAEEKK